MSVPDRNGELEPCPFCGCAMRIDYDARQQMFGPEGEHRGACIFSTVDMHEWSDTALCREHWNTRA